MACPDRVCDNSAVVVTVSNKAGTFTFAEFVGEGDLVDKGATEHVKNIQRSNTGLRTRLSGNNYITMPVTLNLFPCDAEASRFFNAYKQSPMDFVCSQVVINDPCCDVITLEEAVMDSFDSANITSDDTQTSISFIEGRVT